MPPRYAYWTILVDEQPTAFRSSLQEELQPTFNRLKEKHPSARMVWFQNGKVWNSRLDAQEAMRERGDRGRAGDFRQRETGGFRQRQQDRRAAKLEWTPKGAPSSSRPKTQDPSPKSQAPSPKPQVPRPKLEWKPKGAPGTPRPKSQDPRPKSQAPGPQQARAAKSGERRDRTWRPGGEHRDPRQKYKDAKKAKWTRFKKQIRSRWEKKDARKKP